MHFASSLQGKGDMLTWWLVGHDPTYPKKLSKMEIVKTELTDTLNNNTDTVQNDMMTEISSVDEQNENNLRNNTRSRRNGTVLKNKEAHFHEYKEILEDIQDNEYLFTPVELPGQVT